MRIINTDTIIDNIKEMCIEANYVLSEDVSERIEKAAGSEENEIGRRILEQLVQNMDIAKEDNIPSICTSCPIFIHTVVIPVSWHIGILSSFAISIF